MMRGLADPLASTYCHLYMVHCAEAIVSDDKGYLVTSISDINISLRRFVEEKEATYGTLYGDKKLLIALLEPAIEWIMRVICRNEQNVDNILEDFGLKGKIYGIMPCLSVVLHYLLKELPANIISECSLEILDLIEQHNDISFDQHLNYKLLGIKLGENNLSVQYAESVTNKVLQVVSEYNDLSKYLVVVDAHLDILLQCRMDSSLLPAVMDCILEHSKNGNLTENEMDILQSILVKITDHLTNVEDTFALEHFVSVFDLLHGYPRNTVSRHILSKVKRGAPIRDPRMVQFLFEVSRVLCDNIDASSLREDYQQTASLICHFVQMVDFRDEVERQLEFLVDCRASFGNIDELKEYLIHSCNYLAMTSRKGENKFQGLVKACIAFNEVTIPSTSSTSRRLSLYLETAEVALSRGLISHVDGLLNSALSCLNFTDLNTGAQIPFDADWTISLVLKLCSILVVVPGICGEDASHMIRTILSVVQSQSWVTPIMRMRVLSAIVLLSATLSQKVLPYWVNGKEPMGNDLLFFGEKSYLLKLESDSNVAICYLMDSMERESSNVLRGKMALDACNCLLKSLEASQELSSVCSRLITMATSCLLPQDYYLKSTIDALMKHVPDALSTTVHEH